MDTPQPPLLFLDVDGPLIPFGTAGPEEHPAPPVRHSSNPLLFRLDPELGHLLSALRCELVWATTWMDEANQVVSPALGLPALPVVPWPERSDRHIDEWFGLHWKTRTLIAEAAGRTFVWIDDEIGARDREWVADHYAGHALLYRVDPRIGLRHSDVDAIAQWLELSSRPPGCCGRPLPTSGRPA
ncbi:HAD domain-containing protein [Nocardia stercoris]|uniref:Secreted protein n=1 Tax=Nocardia stercoris TaxID=2483361 RepID=A0A3M2L9L4_9NOCA|nr:HAD domain-containing protein [Nocardia stercoris]RMI33410.1 hypothetical protein EBN03_09670 [Nocardia stercoris]